MEIEAPILNVTPTKVRLVIEAAEQQERTLKDYARNCLGLGDDDLLAEHNRLTLNPYARTNMKMLQKHYIVADLVRTRGLAHNDDSRDGEMVRNSYNSGMALFLGALAALAFGYQLIGAIH